MCLDLRLLRAVCQYSELPQLWLLTPVHPYAYTLGAFGSTSPADNLRFPTKPNIRWPTVSETTKHIVACSQPMYPAPSGPRWRWEAIFSKVVGCHFTIVTKACFAKTGLRVSREPLQYGKLQKFRSRDTKVSRKHRYNLPSMTPQDG